MVSIKTYDELISIISLNETCFLKIGASWCNPCKVLHKNIEDVEQNQPDIKFIEIDADDCDQNLLDKFEVRNIPVTIVIKNGQVQSKDVGIQTQSQIENRLLCK